MNRRRSRVRHLQDLQVSGYTSIKGEPSVLYDLPVVRVEAVRQRHQDRFPSPGWQEKVDQACDIDADNRHGRTGGGARAAKTFYRSFPTFFAVPLSVPRLAHDYSQFLLGVVTRVYV